MHLLELSLVLKGIIGSIFYIFQNPGDYVCPRCGDLKFGDSHQCEPPVNREKPS